MIRGTFNFGDFFGDTNCSEALDYSWVAASEAFGEKTFTLNFDMQSFAVAMAVNLGYLSLDTLETAQTQYDPIVVLTDHTDTPNVTYSMSQYFDLRYASMAPIMCIRNLTHAPPNYMTELCMLELPLIHMDTLRCSNLQFRRHTLWRRPVWILRLQLLSGQFIRRYLQQLQPDEWPNLLQQ